VEFRSTTASIADRLEDQSLEIAMFGRVSSGKSSLLNAILGKEILPVRVTPITAVPTRLRYHQTPLLTVWYAERSAETMDISRLAEFASERENPNNQKRVARMVVHLPSTRLREGVTLTRIVKERMINQETPIYSVAPGWTYRELGHGAQLYWNDQQRLHIGALSLAATNSHYHLEGRIKTKLLHVDYLMKHCQGMAQHGSYSTGI
jgi:hypothetical protein